MQLDDHLDWSLFNTNSKIGCRRTEGLESQPAGVFIFSNSSQKTVHAHVRKRAKSMENLFHITRKYEKKKKKLVPSCCVTVKLKNSSRGFSSLSVLRSIVLYWSVNKIVRAHALSTDMIPSWVSRTTLLISPSSLIESAVETLEGMILILQ